MTFFVLKVLSILVFTSLLCGLTRSIVEQDTTPPRTPQEMSKFGTSVAFSSDGTRALVGAPNDRRRGNLAGAAHMYTYTPAGWTKTDVLFPSANGGLPAKFGWSVALSADGNHAVIGAPSSYYELEMRGSAYVFSLDQSTQRFKLRDVLRPKLFTGVAKFGWSVSMSANGKRVMIGAPGHENGFYKPGLVYVFDENPSDPNGEWILSDDITRSWNPRPQDEFEFGYSVALSPDGKNALVGSPGTRGYWLDSEPNNAGVACYLAVDGNNRWSVVHETFMNRTDLASGEPRFGESVAMTPDGFRFVIGAPGDDTVNQDAGAVYVFDEGIFTFKAKQLLPEESTETGVSRVLKFGASVAISGDGIRIVVGSPGDNTVQLGAGLTHVYDKTLDGGWAKQGRLEPETYDQREFNDLPAFGESVAVSHTGDRILVGGPGADILSADTGSAYVFNVCPHEFASGASTCFWESGPSGGGPSGGSTGSLSGIELDESVEYSSEYSSSEDDDDGEKDGASTLSSIMHYVIEM